MAMADLQPGKTVEHHDFRGDIYRFPLGDGIILNLMRTTAGTMRSGDLHNCTQFDVILAGRARLVTYDTVLKPEVAIVYGRDDFIKIPARVPHLFEFLEDNYMVEWWDCDFRAWYYQPYRDRISRAFEAAKAEDAASQAAAAAAGTSEKEAGRAQAASDSSAAKPADQPDAGRAGEQSRVQAARRQQGGGDAAQQQQQQQKQQPKRRDTEGAAGQTAGSGTAQDGAGEIWDAEVAAEVKAAGSQLQHERNDGNPHKGGMADPRLGDPVADERVEANSKRDTAGIEQQGADSSAAERKALPADATTEPELQQPRQQHSHAFNRTETRVGQSSDGLKEAAAQSQKDTTQTAGQDDSHEDIDSAEVAVDQEDYNDAELQ